MANDTIKSISTILKDLGIMANLKGYRYIRTALILLLENELLIDAITKELYPKIAKKHQTTGQRVERAIRHAVEVAWERGNAESLEMMFGYSRNSNRTRPTNSEFLATILDSILIE